MQRRLSRPHARLARPHAREDACIHGTGRRIGTGDGMGAGTRGCDGMALCWDRTSLSCASEERRRLKQTKQEVRCRSEIVQ
jgi:hypothetical protein